MDLNKTAPSAFTIRHKFGVFDNMQGTDEDGNPTALRIRSIRLNPDGNFIFSDGSTEMTPTMGEDGLILIPLQMKQRVFEEWRQDAVKAGESKLSYIILRDLLIEYNDGYIAGDKLKPLPLVYKVTYTTYSGSGDGGGDSDSGTTSTGTVQAPVVALRVTNASTDDIGWIQQEGVWYYKDAANKPVTDWLLGLDGN